MAEGVEVEFGENCDKPDDDDGDEGEYEEQLVLVSASERNGSAIAIEFE